MLREFTTYRPFQIAKFVKRLFKGTFSIAGVGVFYFDKGRVLVPDLNNREMLSVMKEINVMIETISPQLF
ncbi:DUF1107 domain-containing protein [Vibrio sp. JC009]|uniref:DUF1107 family protein n=1 Tax=Vibrio sp. JC009 TaxID=2912314 RepID=UPI0023AEF14E|nr:DUF1107 family protein [Vibrio sp. JC009]WED22124.1 DUF1107 domain-containing protein [Vibrio sp. JC009]